MIGGDNMTDEQIKEIIVACIENHVGIEFASSSHYEDIEETNKFNAQQIAIFAKTLVSEYIK